MTPRLTLGLTNFAPDDPGGWTHLLDRARAADDAGVDRVVVSDHVVFGEDLEAYGRPELGGAVGGGSRPDPTATGSNRMTPLAVIAGTTHARAARHEHPAGGAAPPAVLAKAAATLDVLSGGRLDLGVGVGWQREEYEAAGLDFHQRGRLLDDTLEVCQALWRDSPRATSPTTLRFERIHCCPSPLQPGGVPIWVSGTVNGRVIDRVARFGMRWIAWGPAMSDPIAGVAAMRSGLEAQGHDSSELQVQAPVATVTDGEGGTDLAATMAAVPPLIEGGVTDVRVNVRLPRSRAEATDVLGDVVEAFRLVTL